MRKTLLCIEKMRVMRNGIALSYILEVQSFIPQNERDESNIMRKKALFRFVEQMKMMRGDENNI